MTLMRNFLLLTTMMFCGMCRTYSFSPKAHVVGNVNSVQTFTRYHSKLQVAKDEQTISLADQEKVMAYAESVGVKLSLTTLGPGYRAVARALHDEKQILGYCEGFVRPGGNILHVDKLEVWKKALDRAKKENPDGFKNGGQVFGVSLLLGYMTMLYGKEKNCSIAEFLAIDDEDFQHKRLVRFFQRAGFKKIRYVGEDISNIPDRLVWGGCGTLMNQTIENLLDMWNKILFK